MSIHLHLNNEISSSTENSKLHYIPASIEGNGIANVEKYFENYIETDNNVLLNSFRGYPLKGCNYKVPKEHTGFVLHEAQKPLSENAERDFKMQGKFKEFTYWNWDKTPALNDALTQAMDWIDIAEVLHSPIDPEEDIKQEEMKTKDEQI